MKNYSQGVSAARADGADAVAEMGAVITPRAAHRAMIDGKDHCVALIRSQNFDTRLPARLLLRKDKFAAVEISSV